MIKTQTQDRGARIRFVRKWTVWREWEDEVQYTAEILMGGGLQHIKRSGTVPPPVPTRLSSVLQDSD